MQISLQSVRLVAGRLEVELAASGRWRALRDGVGGEDCLHPTQPAALLGVRFYGETERRLPERVRFEAAGSNACDLVFRFANGAELTVRATEAEGYLKFQVTGGRRVADMQCLYWGPIATRLEGPIGEYLGLLRSETLTLGLISLDPNTDGVGEDHFLSAHWLPRAIGGSFLELQAEDQSRDQARRVYGTPVTAQAVPGLTVLKSAVALFGCRETEVWERMERIEQREGLPHPTVDGEWTKRSRLVRGSAWWADYTEENIDRCLDLAVATGFKWLCRFRTFGNWGHFEPDPRLYPNGFAGFRACTDKAEARGVHALYYTLSTFLKEISVPEPYISPIPDRRLQTVWGEGVLADSLSAADTVVRLSWNADEMARLTESHMEVKEKVIWVDDELIAYQTVRCEGSTAVLEGCTRGFYRTTPAAHATGARTVRILFTYWNNFFPGSEEMNAEVGRRVGAQARQGNFRQVTLDGHEGCLFTGHGSYSKHVFLDAIYQETRAPGFLYTSSNLSNWTWHTLSYISWGEYDCHKGFRGGMLDYRLWRMTQLRSNLMPRRLGQHYPDRHTTVEDIEWLMALAAGWEAGVELHVEIDDFNQNPNRAELVRKIYLWEEARLAGVFTEAQKRDFRQTDRIHSLERAADGTWCVKFVRRWQQPTLMLQPAGSVAIRGTGAHPGRVAPCSIGFEWSHDPGIYQSAWLSDDLIPAPGVPEASWALTPPDSDWLDRCGQGAQKIQFVLRLPKTAGGAIDRPRVRVNDDPELDVCVPVRLQPGQYIAVPHDMPMAYVYDDRHEVVDEIPIRDLPKLPEGQITVTLTADGMAKNPVAPILNIRTHRHIPAPASG